MYRLVRVSMRAHSYRYLGRHNRRHTKTDYKGLCK